MKKAADVAADVLRDPEARDEIDAIKATILRERALAEVREKAGLTQVALAEKMDVSQRRVSKLEHQEDTKLATLRTFVESAGGHLEVVAVFDDDRIPLT